VLGRKTEAKRELRKAGEAVTLAEAGGPLTDALKQGNEEDDSHQHKNTTSKIDVCVSNKWCTMGEEAYRGLRASTQGSQCLSRADELLPRTGSRPVEQSSQQSTPLTWKMAKTRNERMNLKDWTTEE
jgi:hypothetical protein